MLSIQSVIRGRQLIRKNKDKDNLGKKGYEKYEKKAKEYIDDNGKALKLLHIARKKAEKRRGMLGEVWEKNPTALLYIRRLDKRQVQGNTSSIYNYDYCGNTLFCSTIGFNPRLSAGSRFRQ